MGRVRLQLGANLPSMAEAVQRELARGWLAGKRSALRVLGSSTSIQRGSLRA
jgi:hypothetical protein